MAVANVAEILASRGYRVAICDWDLEAPGLERYFAENGDELSRLVAQPGVMDLLLEYKRIVASPNLEEATDVAQAVARAPTASAATNRLQPSELAPLGGLMLRRPSSYLVGTMPPVDGPRSVEHLRLLTAGRRGVTYDAEYAAAVQQFDWNEFYLRWAGEAYIEFFRKDLNQAAEFVLVDSRTGVTEHGGVCTHHLADVVVLMSAPNDQNIDGAASMHRALNNQRLVPLRGGRTLDVLPVGSRVEKTAEKFQLTRFRNRLQREFGAAMPAALVERQFLLRSQIPYVPYYSFEERVVAREPVRERHTELFDAYSNIADALVTLGAANHGVAPRGELALPLNSKEVLAATTPRLNDAFVLANPGADRELSEQLLPGLRRMGVRLLTPSSMPDGGGWSPAELDGALAKSAGVVILIGPQGVTRRIEAEIQFHTRRALERPSYRIVVVSTAPITALTPTVLRLDPLCIADAVENDVLRRTVKALATERMLSPEPSAVSPFPGASEFSEDRARYFFGRDAETSEMLERIRRLTSDRILVVEGDSGAGKSSLVAAGLVPAIRRLGLEEHVNFVPAFCRPSPEPVGSLADALRGACLDAGISQLRAPSAKEIIADPSVVTQFVRTMNIAEAGLLLIIDPLVRTAVDSWPEESASIVDRVLSDLATNRDLACRVILIIGGDVSAVVGGTTAEAIVRLRTLSQTTEHIGTRYPVTPLTSADLHSALSCIGRAVGLSWEADLVARIVRDVGSGSQCSAHACIVAAALWERRTGSVLTHLSYSEIGTAGTVLARAADQIYNELTSERDRDCARRVLLSLVAPGRAGTLDSTRWVQSAQVLRVFEGDAATAFRILSHLVTRGRLIALAHDGTMRLARGMLVQEWERLRQWVDAERGLLIVRDELEEAAAKKDLIARWKDVFFEGFGRRRAGELVLKRPELVNSESVRYLSSLRLRAFGFVLLAVVATATMISAAVVFVRRHHEEDQQRLMRATDSARTSSIARQFASLVTIQADSVHMARAHLDVRTRAVEESTTKTLVAVSRQVDSSAQLRQQLASLHDQFAALRNARLASDTLEKKLDSALAVLRRDSTNRAAVLSTLRQDSIHRVDSLKALAATLTKIRNRHIVWVDDDPGEKRAEIQQLLDWGYIIETARSTESAIIRVGLFQPLVVVSDIERQTATATDTNAGITMMREFRERNWRFRIILYSPKPSDAARRESEALGGVMVTTKSDLLKQIGPPNSESIRP